MSYESKIYICHKGCYEDTVVRPGKYWAQVVAMLDLCAYESVSTALRQKPVTNAYFYADDGSTIVETDEYDQPLTECSVNELLEILQAEIDKGEDYRRLFPLYAMVKTFAEQNDSMWCGRLTVLHYGY